MTMGPKNLLYLKSEFIVNGVELIVNGIGGGAGGVFFLLQKLVRCSHDIYENMPFAVTGLEISDGYLHVKYGLKNVGLYSPKLSISIFGFPSFRKA